jgi:DNA-binding NarL/FixJ family response regulator
VLVFREADPDALDRAISAGVPEIVFGSVAGDELDRAVRSAAKITRRWRDALESVGGASVREAALPHFDLDGCLDRLSHRGELTARERDVLHTMLCGRRIEEIARELHISDNTVKFHVRNVLRKLELRSRSELLRLLVE